MPPSVTVIDTVGAGDTFQAALLFRLLTAHGGPRAALEALDAAGSAICWASRRGPPPSPARAAVPTCPATADIVA
jgi:sugar/nucleoside kinase (ribokinase family)